MSDLVPTFHLRESTPVGERYFYPLPDLNARVRDAWGHPRVHADQVTWWGIPLNEAADSVRLAILDKHTLVSPRQLAAAEARWTTQGPVQALVLRDIQDVTDSSLVQVAREKFGERIAWADKPSDDTLWDSVYHLYEYERGPSQDHAERWELADTVEITGCADPAPERLWVLDNPALGNFYGRHAQHLLPGRTDGLFFAVATEVERRLTDLGLLGRSSRGGSISFYSFDSSRELSVHGQLPYDRPLPWDRVPGRSKAAREANRKREREARLGAYWSAKSKIPNVVPGQTKAEALERFDRLVDEWASKFIPPHTETCSACRGTGFTA